MKKTKIIGLFAVLLFCVINVYAIGLPGGVGEPIGIINNGIDDEIVRIDDRQQIIQEEPVNNEGNIRVNAPQVQHGFLDRIFGFVGDVVDVVGDALGQIVEEALNLFLTSVSSETPEFLGGIAAKSSTIYITSGSDGKILLATKENIGIAGDDANIIVRYKNVDTLNLCQILQEDARKNDYSASCVYDEEKKEYTFWAYCKDLNEEQEKRFWNSLALVNRLK